MSNTPGDPQVYGPYDFSVPVATSAGTGITTKETRTVWSGNYIFARVNGQKLMLTTQEYDNLIAQGQDVEVRTPGT
jgi:hypothetical protein